MHIAVPSGLLPLQPKSLKLKARSYRRHEFKCCGPVLLVVPADMLAFWEGEFEFWAGRDVNVVTYSGGAQARGIVLENELWLQPTSMDGKSATYQSRQALPDRVRLLAPPSVGLVGLEPHD